MTKNKFILVCAFFCGVQQINAQQATSSSGGDATGIGSGSVSYTVGQVNYTSTSSISSGSVSQGVQQAYTITPTGVNNNPNINLSMSVFPNPSVTSITLNIGKQELKDLSFQLFDVQGKLVLQQNITAVITSIKMEEYNTGNYFLKVMSASSELKTFKIIKN